MEKLKTKIKNKQGEEDEMEICPDEAALGRTSRTSSVSSIADDSSEVRANLKRKKMEVENTSEGVLEDIKKERTALEEFLFNENNKVSKIAIKFILAKWSILEGKLYEDRLEKEKLKATYRSMGPPIGQKTYAQSVVGRTLIPASGLQPRKEIKSISNVKEEHEVILIKPVEDTDNRNNDQIKTDLVKELGSVRNKLKVKGIRQMRNKGVILEVRDKRDVDLIRQVDLGRVGLKTEEPGKTSPAIIIFDVESDHKIEDLKEDFICKNFDGFDETNLSRLRKEVHFRHSFRTTENKLNWIVQVPGPYFGNLVNRGRIYMQWRRYRVKEYLNIVRCYKCHGYGHIAKVCKQQDQLCEACGSKDHLKRDCTKKENLQCINCIRNKRKDTNHSVRSNACPEYKRHVEIYKARIGWD